MNMKQLLDRFLWKILFVFSILMQISGITKIPLRFYDIFDFFFSSFCLIGLFGFAWRKRILIKSIWQVTAFLYVFWTFVYAFIFIPSQKLPDGSIGQINILWVNIVSLILFLPWFISLFLYGYKSIEVWYPKDFNLNQKE